MGGAKRSRDERTSDEGAGEGNSPVERDERRGEEDGEGVRNLLERETERELPGNKRRIY